MIMILNVVSLSSTCYCVYVCIHLCSDFSLPHILCMIMILNVFSLFSACYCVNVCSESLFTAPYFLYDCDLNVVFLSSTCYCVNMCIHLCSASKLLFTAPYSLHDHDLKCVFSFLHLLLCERVDSLMLRQ